MKEIIIEINILSLFDILSIATAFMLGVLLLTTKSKNNKANIFLGFFLWSLTTEVLQSLLDGQGIESLKIYATGSLTIPLLFLYIIKTLNYKLKLVYIVFLIPFFIEILGYSSTYFFYTLSLTILIYTLSILKKHKIKLGDFYSDTETKTLSWIHMIIYIFLFFHIFWIIEDLGGLQNENLVEYFAIISNILTFFMIYWIGYNGFSQPEIFNSTLFLLESEETTLEPEFD